MGARTKAGLANFYQYEARARHESLRDDLDLKAEYPFSSKMARDAYKVTMASFAEEFVERHKDGEHQGKPKTFCTALDFVDHKRRYQLHRDTFLVFG